MSRKLTINRLSQDELEYELKYRGIGTGNVQEMRTRLALACRLEKSGDSLRYPDYPFTFEEDSTAVQQKLTELTPEIEQFSGNRTSSDYIKYQTKLSHILGRLDNANPTTIEDKDKKSELLAMAITLLGKLEMEADDYGAASVNIVPPALSMLEQEFQSGVDNVSRSSAVGAAAQLTSAVPCKPVPPSKWDLKFSGDKKGISLNAFLERVEELRIARHVTQEMLLDSGIDLFTGKAYTFYRANREQVETWDELVCLFREEYHPVDFNEKLFEEIRKRTQGPDESIGMYLANMTTFFKRMTCPISEEAKLKILLRNIAPFYQQHLALVDVKSIAELRTICKRLEAKRQTVESFAAPVRRSNMLEPDLAYVDSTSSAMEALHLPGPSSKRDARDLVCYRCQKPGHMARGCTATTGKVCFRCRKEGYTVRTCPSCSSRPSGNANSRS